MTGAAQKDDIRAARCPLCGNLTQEKYKPFCSKRCADLDLSRWLNGVYAVPLREEEDEDGEGGGLIPADRAR
ncbi:MAG: DNA gyrase inhibitor YacG [Proteobacteria bacterium]|nr:DNA gyrase inhibitor YacG [Pseudomonadota bacterium]